VETVVRLLLEFQRPFLVNVNLPQHPIGLCWTRQSVREYNGWVVPGADPMGRQHYWFAAKPLTDPEENTDRWAVDNNFVALTPLRINLTDEAWLQQLVDRELLDRSQRQV
jgi:5'-nucleotidase